VKALTSIDVVLSLGAWFWGPSDSAASRAGDGSTDASFLGTKAGEITPDKKLRESPMNGRNILVTIAALILTVSATAADTSPQPFMTGGQWLGMYESGEAGKEAAASYVAGYVDGVQSAEAVDGVQSAEATSRKKRFCVPETVTELELADVVAKYLAGKSVFRQMGAPFVIDGALKDVYRC